MKDLLKKIEDLKLDKKKILLLILVLVTVIYIDFTFLLASQLKAVANTGKKIAKLDKDINNVNKDLILARQSKAKENKEDLFRAQKMLVEAELNDLLREIAHTANDYKIRLMHIRPSKESPPKHDKVLPQDKPNGLLIALELIGDYHELGMFLNDLEYMPIYLAVKDLKISADAGNYLKQRINLVLKTYVKK